MVALWSCRGGDVAVHGQRGDEAGDLRGAHLGRVALTVEEDVAPDPCDVGVFGPTAIVAGAQGGAHSVDPWFTPPCRETGPTQGFRCARPVWWMRPSRGSSTQNQALSALLFLYRDVLEVDLPWLDGIVRAKRPAR